MDLQQLEALALSEDRAAAVAALLPGTAEQDYYRALRFQHEGRLDEVDGILDGFSTRHPHHDEMRQRLAVRQLLLRAGCDLASRADAIRFEAGLSLDDQAEAETAAERWPTSLDPAVLDLTTLIREALRRGSGLEQLTSEGLLDLLAGASNIDPNARRELLQRLPRANLPAVVPLCAAEVAESSSGGFGRLGIRGLLTLEQMLELGRLVPSVRDDSGWVRGVLARLRPPRHVDWQSDLEARRDYLDALWTFVSTLGQTFNTLKAHVLYHRLDLDRRLGVHDEARLLLFLGLPSRARYLDRGWTDRFPSGAQVAPRSDEAQAAGLGPMQDDEALVRDHLQYFLARAGMGAFAGRLRDKWLRREMAEARLLAGDPDARWARALGEDELTALRDRVEIQLSPTNPDRFGRDQEVVLEATIKNVAELSVKVFRIDATAYFMARGEGVDTSLDLDGMMAGDERVLRIEAPPIQRTHRRIALPGCARPGVYVVELIGNGKSSRALIRKGGLRHTARTSAAGPAITVYDETGRKLSDARVLMGGRSYEPRDDGEIILPFSTHPGEVSVLLVQGDVVQRARLDHPAERYELRAGVHLEREALVPGKTARMLLRPMLSVAGTPVSIALLEGPRVELTATDLAGTTSTKSEPVALRDDAETAVALRVPEDAVKIAVRLSGKVRVVSTQQTLDVSCDLEGEHNTVHRTGETELAHLASTERGHVLWVLGKSGEARPGRMVSVSLSHRAVTFTVDALLSTDERGRIELGRLPGVTRLVVRLPSGTSRSWELTRPVAAPRSLHVASGTPLTLPAPTGLDADAPAGTLSLTELRGNAPARDVTSCLCLERRALFIGGLGPGEYTLRCRGLASEVSITVVPGAAPNGDFAVDGAALVELSPPIPLIREASVEADAVVLRLSGVGPETRVHLFATLFLPDRVLPSGLFFAPRTPRVVESPLPRCAYLSGRELGDEHRYVLERRRAPRRPGMLLDKPSLLLDPWSRRATANAVQAPVLGGAYASEPLCASAAPRPEPKPRAGAPSVAAASFATFDFLAAPATLLDNLRPDAEGFVRVPRAALGAAHTVQAIVVDPALTTSAELELCEIAPAHRDRRLLLALDPERHFAEDRRILAVTKGDRVVVEDVRSGKLELCDTVGRAHQVLSALMSDAALAELGFVATWASLDEAARRRHYSKYVCHELNLFLFVKDRAFFEAVVRPHLASRRHKTLVDRFLLGEDLGSYLEPWAFGRLNTLERILLARAVPALREAVARLLGDAVDLIPPDPERDARLIDTLLGAAALEEGGLASAGDALCDCIVELEEADEEEEKERSDAPKLAKRASEDKAGMVAEWGRGGGAGGARDAADLRDRGRGPALYRGADQTQEWAETGWWRQRSEDTSPALIPPNRFWRDLAMHREGPFLSPYLAECVTSFSEALCALAFLDLPFVAGAHEVALEDVRLTVTAASPALAARSGVAEVEAPAERSPILVGQSYFRADDRWTFEGAERREKYVTGELLTAVVYQCQVVVTNPTSTPERLDVLLQIPRGAVPVSSGFYTRTHHLHLGAHGTEALEYAFYFPSPGSFPHFPAHVLRAGAVAASAAPKVLHVVREPTTLDTASWPHVSQRGTLDEVLAFLERGNLGRVDLDKIAFRMRDREAFTKVTALLARRWLYHDRLWSYGLMHADPLRVGEWLRHQDALVAGAGPCLEGGVVDLDPLVRGTYQHLEYAPLINARAHQLGERRRILNDALAAQYRAFLELVAHRARPTDDDLLTAAHYLFCFDRIDEALAALQRVAPKAVTARIQYDYLCAYAACCRADLATARRLAAPWMSHPVDRWRARFAALGAMLDEAEGRTAAEGFAAAMDPDSREQRMAEMAAGQPSLSAALNGTDVLVEHHRLAGCQVRLHRMDLELCFSRQPFLQGDIERFTWIEPSRAFELAFSGDGRTPVPIPAELAHENLVIEVVASGQRAQLSRYAHDLGVQVAHAYGQLRVLRASSRAPLPATYVKVYARRQGGEVAFYKDGYTDLRGRFDYVTLSTDDLERVERFAILVASDEAGAMVVEASPPQR